MIIKVFFRIKTNKEAQFDLLCLFTNFLARKMEIKFTPLSQIGEFKLIDEFKSIAAKFSNPVVLQGIGDDTSIIKPSQDKHTLVTTDILTQAVHFDLSYTSMKHLGQKAALVNLSDIAAMSGLPVAAFVSLGIHSGISVEMIKEFYESLANEFGKLNCTIAGGDTSASPIGFVISITLVGEVEPDRQVLRNGAKAGDVICVTGDLGRAKAGLRILQREKDRYIEAGQPADFSPNFEGYDDALQKHLLPESRIMLSRTLTEKIKVHSMIDVSDGLISDMMHICLASSTHGGSSLASEIDEELIPIDPITRKVADELGENSLDYALLGGEDYELLFTIAEKDFTKLHSLEGNVRAIGRVKEGQTKVAVRRVDGKTDEYVGFPSYQHFTSNSK
ncbi:MAG TPA: thiamine-phosphate kinase [Candidatus Acidoferrales bacterium]|nr:thiamine-phosphate kinase [Candidatus Acidoferrales bacterium]